jgi:NAD-dependent dihydropyrimidine dehydrogenase PreA subunit
MDLPARGHPTKVFAQCARRRARGLPLGARDHDPRARAALDYTVQVAPEDCTGCGLCVEVCPAKDQSNPRRKALV